MEGLKIKTNFYSNNNEIIIIQLGGYIDQTNSGEVEKVIADILKSGKRKLVFDLSELVYMSSAGWGIFVGEIKTVRDQGGDIKITAMTPEVYEVFQMLEFYHIIKEYATVQEAVEDFPGELKAKTEQASQPAQVNPDNGSIDELLEQSGLSKSVVADDDDVIHVDKKENVQQKEKLKVKTTPVKPIVQVKKLAPSKPIIRPERKVDITSLPLNEKVKRVIASFPLLNVFQIRRMLAHEKFGYTRVGVLKLYRILRNLNLENKVKRYRYYRSV